MLSAHPLMSTRSVALGAADWAPAGNAITALIRAHAATHATTVVFIARLLSRLARPAKPRGTIKTGNLHERHARAIIGAMALRLSARLQKVQRLCVVFGVAVGFTAFPLSARAEDGPAPEPDSADSSASAALTELQLNERLFEKLFVAESVSETRPQLDITRDATDRKSTR